MICLNGVDTTFIPVPGEVDTLVLKDILGTTEILTKISSDDTIKRSNIFKQTIYYALTELDNPDNLFPPYEHAIYRHGTDFHIQAWYLAVDVKNNIFTTDFNLRPISVLVKNEDHKNKTKSLYLNRMVVSGSERLTTELFLEPYLTYLAILSCENFDEFVSKFNFLAKDINSFIIACKYADISPNTFLKFGSKWMFHKHFYNNLKNINIEYLSQIYASLPIESACNSGSFVEYNASSCETSYLLLNSIFRKHSQMSEYNVWNISTPKAVFENYYIHWLNSMFREIDVNTFNVLSKILRRNPQRKDYVVPNILTIYQDTKIELSDRDLKFSPIPNIHEKFFD